MASRKTWLIVLITITIATWLVVLILFLSRSSIPGISQTPPLPTLAVIPSLTATTTQTATPTAPPTITPTPTASATSTATSTPTLAVRVLEITAIMPGVTLEPTRTAIPSGMTVLPAPPNPVEPLPDATHTAPPFTDWYSFESDYPTVRYEPVHWTPRQMVEASRGQYHRYEGTGRAVFPFEGDGLRVRYVAARNMGIFEIVVDGQVIDTIDAYRPQRQFPGTRVYSVGAGQHLLEIRATGQRNPRSEGTTVGLDAIQVYRAAADTLIIPPSAISTTPSPTPRPAQSIELIQAPPTRIPTATPPPPVMFNLSVVIAYDENGNRDVDPAEGVFGVPVRAVAANTNRVIAQSLTDTSGYAHVEVITTSDVRVVVPYFGEVWNVSYRTTGGSQHFTLLLEPGNQPGIIP